MSQEDFARLPEFREQESHYMDAEDEWDEKLKPCPFCGAPAELQTVPDGHPDSGAMFCQCSGNGCLASSALILPLMDDVTELVRERWNRRADEKYMKALAGLPDGAIDGGLKIDIEAALVADNMRMRETLQAIVDADWRKWQELASSEEFVRWAKSRANHALLPANA